MAKVEAEGGIRVRSNTSMEPIVVHEITVEVNEVASTINAGFQAEWGRVDVDGDELLLYSGAGMGSGFATINFRGKRYTISAAQLVEQFLTKVAGV